jgi:AcrR family transcriptional regulator
MSAAVKPTNPRRAYRSSVREASAGRTRQAIVTAAGALFLEQGYSAASLANIAAAAGVARPTVFAVFGSKPAILREVLDQALAGDDQPVPVAERIWFRPVWEAGTAPAVLEAYAEVCTLIGRRAARLFETVRRAADDSTELADLWATLRANRRAGAQMVVEHLLTLGTLTAGLELQPAVDALWLLNDPAHYASLVLECGWPEPRFRGWLAGMMRGALLPG